MVAEQQSCVSIFEEIEQVLINEEKDKNLTREWTPDTIASSAIEMLSLQVCFKRWYVDIDKN